ncbi:Type II CAAX prenyl endopeptidase Rce1-like [Dillenia turbinata]|uniref:Type II CAAX prenyl endopeptidase Rce1-like n=1 Tax=Dillenia turbinata TaxID=194707 RepID=A0AAN8VKP7_9MAGN
MLSSRSLPITHRPFSPPPPRLLLPSSSALNSFSRFRVSNQSPLSLSISPRDRTFRAVDSHLNLSNNRWKKISCFRHEDFEAENRESEFREEIRDDKLIRLHSSKSSSEEKNLFQNLQEAVKSLFRDTGQPWEVPWTAETTVQVMLIWIASFWLLGSWVIPFAAHMAGFNRGSLTYRGQALYSLLTDITEGLAGIAILRHRLSHFRPLPSDLFKCSLRGTWYLDVALGCFLFPLVNHLSQVNLVLLPLMPSAPVTISSVEQSIIARDPVAMALYATVVSVCAPVWEEIVFRGFLLPSLSKYMPVWCSILISSVAFALAHFNVQRMLPLIFLGVLMGVVLARTRNLFAPMVLHSLWNGFVFLDLMK